MVSLDDPKKNQEFAESLDAAHVVLSDLGGVVADRYGVTGLGGLYARRWTFYIGADGAIRYGQDIAKRLVELEFPKRADR